MELIVELNPQFLILKNQKFIFLFILTFKNFLIHDLNLVCFLEIVFNFCFYFSFYFLLKNHRNELIPFDYSFYKLILFVN